jgi:DNA polymerase-3 subunit epsilon
MEKRPLAAAYKVYCGKELEGAHGGAADIRATYDVLKPSSIITRDGI